MSEYINGIEMVTNRSSSDVVLVKSFIKKGFQNMTDEEKQTFLAGMKGAYNYTDVNRVESAVSYLAERLVSVYDEIRELAKELGVYWNEDVYGVPYDAEDYKNWDTKNDWAISDRFTEEERRKYLDKITAVLLALASVPENFPVSLEKMNYIGANTIEQSLVDFKNHLEFLINEKRGLIIGTAKSWFYSGDIYGGEV